MVVLGDGSEEGFRKHEVTRCGRKQARMIVKIARRENQRRPGAESHAVETAMCWIETGLSRRKTHVHELSRTGTGEVSSMVMDCDGKQSRS